MKIARLVLIIVCMLCPALAPAQKSDSRSEVLLTVEGKLDHSLSLTRADLDKFKRDVVIGKSRDGKEHKYEGVAVVNILQKAGVQFGEMLHMEAAATYLLAEASDGYRVVFALPEFDSATAERMILIADRVDGNPIPAAAGPLQLIAPGDKSHGRWVRQVKSLTLVVAPPTK